METGIALDRVISATLRGEHQKAMGGKREIKRMTEDRGDAMKLQELFHNYVKGNAKLPYLPLCVRIEPTNHCNLRCQMCPRSLEESYRNSGFMDMVLYEEIIREVAEFPRSKVYPCIALYLGGEPLLHKNIVEMVRMAKEAGLAIHLNTNCALLTPETSLSLLETGIDLVNLSFDDSSKEEYEDFRRNADYDLVLNNIIDLLRIKKQRGFDKTIVKIVGLRINKEDTSALPEVSEGFAKNFEGLPLDGIEISWAHAWTGESKRRFTEGEDKIDEYYPCYFLWRDITIGWDGKVLGCCYDILGEQVMGDVSKNKMSEVWNNDVFQEARRNQVSGEYYKTNLCRGCELLSGKVDISHFWRDFYPFVQEHCEVKTRWE